MANISTVDVTAGAPTAGTGTVYTLNGIFDPTNAPIAVKAASTAPVATDKAMVVAISPNSPGLVQTGTAGSPSATVLTVQGVTSGTTLPVSSTPTPTTAGGLTSVSTIITTANGVLNIKASAGSIKKIEVSNADSAGFWFKLVNNASTPVAGTTAVVRRLWIPAGSVCLISYEFGLDFTTGIGYYCTSGIADNNTGAITASTAVVSIDYK